MALLQYRCAFYGGDPIGIVLAPTCKKCASNLRQRQLSTGRLICLLLALCVCVTHSLRRFCANSTCITRGTARCSTPATLLGLSAARLSLFGASTRRHAHLASHGPLGVVLPDLFDLLRYGKVCPTAGPLSHAPKTSMKICGTSKVRGVHGLPIPIMYGI